MVPSVGGAYNDHRYLTWFPREGMNDDIPTNAFFQHANRFFSAFNHFYHIPFARNKRRRAPFPLENWIFCKSVKNYANSACFIEIRKCFTELKDIE